MIVAFGSIELRREFIVRISCDLLVFFCCRQILILALKYLSQSETRLERILSMWILFEVILSLVDPAGFEGRAPLATTFPFDARDLKTHICCPLRVGTTWMTSDFIGDLLHQVQSPLRVVEVGGVLISFGVLAALRRSPIIFCCLEWPMLIVKHVS